MYIIQRIKRDSKVFRDRKLCLARSPFLRNMIRRQLNKDLDEAEEGTVYIDVGAPLCATLQEFTDLWLWWLDTVGHQLTPDEAHRFRSDAGVSASDFADLLGDETSNKLCRTLAQGSRGCDHRAKHRIGNGIHF